MATAASSKPKLLECLMRALKQRYSVLFPVSPYLCALLVWSQPQTCKEHWSLCVFISRTTLAYRLLRRVPQQAQDHRLQDKEKGPCPYRPFILQLSSKADVRSDMVLIHMGSLLCSAEQFRGKSWCRFSEDGILWNVILFQSRALPNTHTKKNQNKKTPTTPKKAPRLPDAANFTAAWWSSCRGG